ncbi:4Fe-4S binding protein, partial [Patescibacteria group bacterium]|nr:4Fe-4S binding protein [Patescibacteria group bacterium]
MEGFLICLTLFIWSNEMAHKINDECVACGACESECPTEA